MGSAAEALLASAAPWGAVPGAGASPADLAEAVFPAALGAEASLEAAEAVSPVVPGAAASAGASEEGAPAALEAAPAGAASAGAETLYIENNPPERGIILFLILIKYRQYGILM